MKHDSNSERMNAAGVPAEARATTTAREGMVELRSYIQGHMHQEKPALYIRPKASRTGANLPKAELGFYLAAKEMILSGHSVAIVDLVELRDILRGNSDDDAKIAQVSRADIVAIRYFFNSGGNAPCFLSPDDVAYLSSWIDKRMYANEPLILLATDLPIAAEAWWPQSTMFGLRRRMLEVEVGNE